ncbi:MAG: restriction endonuclease subunit S [bacterium]|nr:restriction endonuclease subunit S [bacterium]MDE0668909.1 restriction endonuclease subunit S [bacterium]MXZ30206.1 restriction endonuclease subunit S [Acidimicrobiia bacterium]MYJ14560.1 restriction endonuclease subunit S [Acidimicrobiia bacterium]
MDTDDLRLQRWGDVDDSYLGPAFHMRFRPGQVLYGSRRTYLRKVAVADFEGICANTTFVLEPSSADLLPEFLPQVMSTERFHEHSVQQSKGSVNPYINFRDLTWYEFALPPARHQGSIAKVLERARQAAHEAAQVRTALVSLRDALIDDATWDSSCGQWSVPLVRVGDLLDGRPRNGLSPKASSEPGAVRSVTLSAIRDGRFTADEDTEKWCEPSSRAPEFRVNAGDVFIVRGNGNRSLVGRAGLALVKPEPACVYPDLLIRLRFEESRIDPFLATALWNHERVHERLLGRAKSSNGIYKVNGMDISSHELPVPPAAEGRALLSRLRAIDELQSLCEVHAVAADKLVPALREKVLLPDGLRDV